MFRNKTEDAHDTIKNNTVIYCLIVNYFNRLHRFIMYKTYKITVDFNSLNRLETF